MSLKYILSTETGLILGVLGIILAVISIWLKKRQSVKSIVTALALVLCFAAVFNHIHVDYITKEEYSNMPDLHGVPLDDARLLLRSIGLKEKPSAINGQTITDASTVFEQELAAHTQVKKGTEVLLFVYAEATSVDHDAIDNVLTERQSLNKPADTESLTLHIDSYQFNDTYYYEQPNPDVPGEYWIIEFENGISGTFSYSRPLSEQESKNWFHGGKLYDADHKEVIVNGNYPSIWSCPEGLFAVEFPHGMAHGNYTFELYQFLDGVYVSDMIEFTV